MATVSSTLALQDKITKTLESANKSARKLEGSMNSADKGVKNLDKSMSNASSSSSGFLKSLLSFRLVEQIFSGIMGQLGNAIQRFDTLNNYVNVMSNLGISAEDAQKSIDRMKTGLDGLPTTLQDGAMAVQRFTSANGNIQASTEMFLALNNAILAGGGSAMTQASALEQLSQSYAKGKPDMMEWRTAMSAMPAQLNQVAKVMGFVSADALGESLRKGTTSMNDFMKTLVRMNSEGVDGFKSLDEQARNATGGIQTSITNFRTAITKGLEDMIRTTNETLKNSGLPTIQEMIKTAGKKIQEILINTGKIIGKIIGFVGQNWNWIKPTLIALISLLVAVKVAMIALSVIQGINNAITTVATAIQMGYAASLWSTVWPILVIVSAIAMWILYIHLLITAWNAFTGETVSTVGIIMGYLGVLRAFVYNRFVVPTYNAIAMLVNFLANCFQNPVAAIQVLFLDLAINVLGYFTGMIQGIIDLINQLMEKLGPVIGGALSLGAIAGGVNISERIDSLNNSLKDARSNVVANSGYNEVVKQLEYEDYKDAAESGYNWGANLGKGFTDGINLDSAMADLGEIDWDSLNNSIGTDSTGGKAVKTTTNDKLLSDEDIQLLLDVATRDYKLNYQKVEPNITITFGDVRETADVDDILDKVADRLEEIYDGDLEVVKQ